MIIDDDDDNDDDDDDDDDNGNRKTFLFLPLSPGVEASSVAITCNQSSNIKQSTSLDKQSINDRTLSKSINQS